MGERVEITINCCLCEDQHHAEIALPKGWANRIGLDEEENSFCPRHAKVAEFASAQCPGCVGGWGDCPMWRAFALGGDRSLTAQDFATLERGICPRRVNGTIGVSVGRGKASLSDIDLSDAAPEGGAAFAQAIRDYCARYPSV